MLLWVWMSGTKSFGQQFNYAPNSIYYCQLQGRYDSSLGAGLRRGSDTNGTEWQLAFSPVKHGAVMLNYFDGHHKAIRKQQEEGSSSQSAEIGLGAYETLAHGTASLFIGYGQGSIFSNYSLSRSVALDLQRWFIQPAMIFRNHNFEWGLALRFNRLVYSHAEVDFSISESDLQPLQAIEAQSPFFIPEFGLHAGIVFKPCTLTIDMTSLFYDTNTFNFERLNSAFLLTVDLGFFYQRKKEPKAQ